MNSIQDPVPFVGWMPDQVRHERGTASSMSCSAMLRERLCPRIYQPIADVSSRSFYSLTCVAARELLIVETLIAYCVEPFPQHKSVLPEDEPPAARRQRGGKGYEMGLFCVCINLCSSRLLRPCQLAYQWQFRKWPYRLDRGHLCAHKCDAFPSFGF